MENKSPEYILESEICRFLLCPTVRSQIISHMSTWMFTNSSTKAIISSLTDEIFEGKKIEKNHLILHIKQNFKQVKLINDDYKNIFDILSNEIEIKEDNREFVVHSISKFIRNRLTIKGAKCLLEGNEEEAYKFLENGINFSVNKSPFIDPSDTGLVQKLKEMSTPNGKIIKSSISVYNKASVYGGLKYGDLISVCAPPKVGKTTLMCQEGAYFCTNNLKVAHVCLGDMDNFDVICKYVSNITGEPMEVIVDNPTSFFGQYPAVKDIMKNVRISCFPAGELGIRELLGHLRQLKQNFDFDVAIVDYDSNIASPKTDNLYEAGGIIYTALKGFAEKERCVVYVGSQPKIGCWENEVLDMASASESSRKQHTVDAMITMGRNKDYKYIGTYNIACLRRGESGVSVRIKFDYKGSSIKEIRQQEYDELLNNNKKPGGKPSYSGNGGGGGFNDSI